MVLQVLHQVIELPNGSTKRALNCFFRVRSRGRCNRFKFGSMTAVLQTACSPELHRDLCTKSPSEGANTGDFSGDTFPLAQIRRLQNAVDSSAQVLPRAKPFLPRSDIARSSLPPFLVPCGSSGHGVTQARHVRRFSWSQPLSPCERRSRFHHTTVRIVDAARLRRFRCAGPEGYR